MPDPVAPFIQPPYRDFKLQKKFAFDLLCLLLAGLSFSAQAQQDDQILPPQLPLSQVRSIELNAGGQTLTGGYPAWRQMTLRGNYETGVHVLQGELSAKKEFNQSGTFAGVGDTFTINPDWYANVSVGAGDGAFYLPRFRADGALSKKWLENRSLVTTVGLGYYSAPDGHVDRGLLLSAAYYFDAPLVVEGGVRYNRSSPGGIVTHQQFLAATLGRDKQDLVSGRIAWGSEGYLAIAENTTLVDFQSKELSLAWRHWITQRWGFVADANFYRNPTYDRRGANFGFFHHFD